MATVTVLKEIAVGEIVVIFGPPLGGKTAPSQMLETWGGFVRGVCYDIVMEATNGSLKAQSDAAKRWDDSVVNRVITRYLCSKPLETRHVLDGFPRTRNQARALLGFATAIRAPVRVINLLVPYEVCAERLSTRNAERIERKLLLRRDDDPKLHEIRYRDYENYRRDVIAFFRSHGIPVYEMDGTLPKEEVCERVRELILG